MKIKAIRYQNFRQFGERGEVTFDTDNKVTIVYGANGDGKTTLHQLFQWILYKRISFNKTTTDAKLYNLAKGEKLSPECSFLVWGEIEFEHEHKSYLVRRECAYYKQKTGNIIHMSDRDEFVVKRRQDNNNWDNVESPESLIEEVLPSGLAPYFFFDGETMIADLKVKGSDSARTLRKALYSIFDLEAYEKAVEDIGRVTSSTTVLGHLSSLKLKEEEKSATEEQHKEFLRDIRILNRQIEKYEDENHEIEEVIKNNNQRLHIISEQIGSNKSRSQLENARKSLKNSKERELEFIKKEMLLFGKEIENNYAYLLISEVVKTADTRLYLQVQEEEKKIIPGLKKELLLHLLKNADTQECLCGRCIGQKEKDNLEIWKSFFPPASYKSTYDKFSQKAKQYAGKYDSEKLYEFLRNIFTYKNNIKQIEKQIEEIDENLKSCGDIDTLICERNKLESDNKKFQDTLVENGKHINHYKHQLTIRERKRENFEKANSEVSKFAERIAFMEAVASELKKRMNEEVKEYSRMLEKEIQSLVEEMLTSKRKVCLSEDFLLQVMDSYSDESKSEGQFAVVSFAYIGGIFKVLKNHERLKDKEYPLVLDGPFSKLGDDHKENVIKTIPQYAPQIIIFSKDRLDDFIEEDKIGKVWTIVSNDEKNDAQIKEGLLWK